MIFYGTSNTIKESGEITMTCTNCGSLTSHLSKIFNYFYIYWLPVIPLTTQVATTCTNCQKLMYGKEVPEATKLKALEKTKDIKRPFYHYIGLIVIACLIAFGVNSSNKSAEQRAAYIAAPKVSDVYAIKVDDFFKDDTKEKHPDELDYTLMKLVQIDQGVAQFVLADATFSSPRSGVDYFEKGEVKFTDYIISLNINELPKLNKEDKIRDILRKE